MAAELSGADVAVFEDNTATVAGGAVFYDCPSRGATCESAMAELVAVPTAAGIQPLVRLEGNTAAGYGGDVATGPARISFAGGDPSGLAAAAGLSSFAVPGMVTLSYTLAIYDGSGAIVRGATDLVVRVRVCPTSARSTSEAVRAGEAGKCSDSSSLLPSTYYPVDAATGLCDVSNQQALACSIGAAAILVHFSLAALTQAAGLTPLVHHVQCLPCGPSQQRKEGSAAGRPVVWVCADCTQQQYVIDSNNVLHGCQDCPEGAICNGSGLVGRVAGSVWVPDYTTGQYKLVYCPPGYELINSYPGSSNFSDVEQTCQLCKASFYCPGNDTPKIACPSETYSPAGSNSSAACTAVVFVQVTVKMPMTQAQFSSGRQQSFVQALADACGEPVSHVSVGKVTPTGNSSSSSISVEASVMKSSTAEAEALVADLDATKLNAQLLLQNLPDCTGLSVRLQTPPRIGQTSGSDQWTQWATIGVVLGTVLVGLIVLQAARRRKGSPEERELQRAVAALRARLRITQKEGFVLSSEGAPPLWRWRWLSSTARRRQTLGFVQKGHAEAAARLSLLQDFDVSQFDGFCLSLEGERGFGSSDGNSVEAQTPYELLCEWLLELSASLIQPDVSGHCHGGGDSGGSGHDGKWIGAVARLPGGTQCSLAVEHRFPFFVRRVCHARIWMDDRGALFRRLKAIAAQFMGFVAELCETRFEALLKEPQGNELLSAHLALPEPDFQQLHIKLPTVGVGIACSEAATSGAAHHEPFSPPEPEPACCRDGSEHRADDELPAQRAFASSDLTATAAPQLRQVQGHETPQHVLARRQDHPEVRAVVVYDEARSEALVEGSSLGGVSRDGTKEAALLEEEVFLAQLHRRAHLLNDEFQERVAEVVLAHAAGGEDAGEEDLVEDSRREEDRMSGAGPSDGAGMGMPNMPSAAGRGGFPRRQSRALIAAVRASPFALVLERIRGWLGRSKVRVADSSCARPIHQAELVSTRTAGGTAMTAATPDAGETAGSGGKNGAHRHGTVAAEGHFSAKAVSFENHGGGELGGHGLGGLGGLVRGDSDGSLLHSEDDGRSRGSSSISAGSTTRAVCTFKEGTAPVEVYAAPVKTLARMREKVSEYAGEAGGSNGGWPLCANILDPVRASVVCAGPSQIIQVLSWYTVSASELAARDSDATGGPAAADSGERRRKAAAMPVCRVKNKFAFAKDELVGGYRDLMFCVVFTGSENLRIIGEIQIQDRALHELKLKMHKLYKITRAHDACHI